MMKKLYYILFLFPVLAFAQDQNYIKSTAYKVESTTPIATPTALQAAQAKVYFDGLGRPIQRISSKQSSSGKDIIVPIVYDAFGRQPKEYLPYPSSGNTMAFDSAPMSGLAGYAPYAGQNAYGEKSFEKSPLNRMLEQGAAGAPWALGTGHTLKFGYRANAASEVRLFKAVSASPSAGTFNITLINGASTVFYPQGQLIKSVVFDENSTASPVENAGATVEFKDKEGRVILRRVYGESIVNNTAVNTTHDTYYIYDQYGNLTYVIPPKVNLSVSVSAEILNKLCYQYKYDYSNRLIEKKLPGKQWEFIVYDKLDRVVATGPSFSPFTDAAAPSNIGWLVTKYDIFNRVAYTGWIASTTVTADGRKTLQSQRNAQTSNFNETKTTTGTNTLINGIGVRYTDVAWPAANTCHVLTANYYDNYDFSGAPITIPATVLSDNSQPVYYNNGMKPVGLPTGGLVRVLQGISDYNCEVSYVLYDKKSRPVRSYSKNFLGGFIQKDSKIDFTGKTLLTETTQQRLNETAIVITENFTYNDQDRLLSRTHKINSEVVQLLSSNTYDELGQLIVKKVGNTVAAPLQTINYSYNIRGWLTGVNNDATNNIVLNTAQKDLFGFKINYNTVEGSVSGMQALYNGNVAETYWRSSSDNILRKYSYRYDQLNRLKTAVYQKPALSAPTNAYDESMTYDKNGNIMQLWRNGNQDYMNSILEIDNLTYGYTQDSNQLSMVYDASNSPVGFKDNTPAALTDTDFTYDANGNLLTDNNKGITSVKYNHLNLPIEIVFNNSANAKISYLYNATGQKIQKSAKSSAANATVTDYLDGFQYRGGVLQFFPTAEGYVKNTLSAGLNNYNYVFNYTDHVGNIRLSYSRDPANPSVLKILEENHYYPYGLKHANYNSDLNAFMAKEAGGVELKSLAVAAAAAPGGGGTVANIPDYNYKYNGKELQQELGLNVYDYGARNYDPAIGRWMNIDPLAEQMRRHSPYNYCFNNPVYFTDPDGMAPTYLDQGNEVSENNDTLFKSSFLNQNGGHWTDKLKTQDSSNSMENSDNEEEPVNLFSDAKDQKQFKGVATSRRYKERDAKWSLYGHGGKGFIQDQRNGKKDRLDTAEKIDALMGKLNPNWDELKNKKGAVLAIWSCESASTNEYNLESLAYKVSKFFPEMIVIGADGFVKFAADGSKVTGIDKNLDSGDNLGKLVTYKNGEIVNSQTFKDIKK